MATTELHLLWQTYFPDKLRPVLFTGTEYNEDGFLPLANPKDFAVDIPSLSSQQLYAVSSNNQIALKQAQDEFLELEHEINIIRHPDPTNLPAIKNPQMLPSHQEFEERKEALLYNYKYDAKRYPEHKKNSDVTEQEKRDSRFDQDPFNQGGFVPNDRQYRALRTKAKDPRNIDGWVPIERDGQRLIPRMFHELVKDPKETVTRSKTASVAGTRGRAGTEDFDDVSVRGTPGPVQKVLRTTRFNGTKVPVTRDASEDPSYPPSRSSTPKRKRGETPLPSIETGSPLKKMRVNTAEPVEAPRRKRQNQYTKAKELRERNEAEPVIKPTRHIEAYDVELDSSGTFEDLHAYDDPATALDPTALAPPPKRRGNNQYTRARERATPTLLGPSYNAYSPRTSDQHIESGIFGGLVPAVNVNNRPVMSHHGSVTSNAYSNPYRSTATSHASSSSSAPPSTQHQAGYPGQEPASKIKVSTRQPQWMTMTAEQKLEHKWDSESLIAALRHDYTWLPESTDKEKRAERDRLLAQKNPHRSFSIKSKWRFWKAAGKDKRPRKTKGPSNVDGTFFDDDGMNTPGHMSEHEVHVYHEKEAPGLRQQTLGAAHQRPGLGEAAGMTTGYGDGAWTAADLEEAVRRSGRAKR